MNILRFIFFLILVFTTYSSENSTNFNYTKKDITEFSEIGYNVKYGGWYIGEDDPPQLYQYSLICRNKRAFTIFANIWNDGRKRELRKRVSTKKYLKFWRKVEQYDVWKLKSINVEKLTLEINGEYKKDLDPYVNCPTEGSTHEFFIIIRDKEHRFKAYAIDSLKDKRYIKIEKEINKFFDFREDVARQ